MQEEKATVPGTETAAPTATEPSAPSTPEATDSSAQVEQPIEKTDEEKAQLESDREALRKENDKLQMEINMRRKEVERSERERVEKEADAEKRAEEYRRLLEERDERDEADRQAREAKDLRDRVLSQQPENVQKLARALLEKNPYAFVWPEGATVSEAERALTDQLAVFQDLQAPTPEPEKQPEIHPNNPPTTLGGRDPRELTLEELSKVLEKAPAR